MSMSSLGKRAPALPENKNKSSSPSNTSLSDDNSPDFMNHPPPTSNNPFAPLADNPIILWSSVIQFIVSGLPETG